MSLFKDIENDLKRNHPRLYNDINSPFAEFGRLISKSNFWQVFLTFILIIFCSVLYTKFLNYDFLKVLNIDFTNNVKTFTTSIITLVSINLFVTNLLFTHLKEERDDLQAIIDEQVNFKFITYLGFTLIVCILLIYFLAPTIGNIEIKSNVLIIIFSSFLLYIFQLIFLYDKVFSFLNKVKRKKIIEDTLTDEFTKVLRNAYLKKEFNKRYQKEMGINLGFATYSPFKAEHKSDINYISLEKSNTVYLKDVNLENLKKLLENNKSVEKYYYVLELDQRFDKGKSHPLLILTDTPYKNKKVINCFSFSKKQRFHANYSQIHINNLIQKIDYNTVENNYFELFDNLNDLERIYELYLDIKV